MIFGWLICKVKGKHRRGVRYEDRTAPGPAGAVSVRWETIKLRCPRCGSTWERKNRAPAIAA